VSDPITEAQLRQDLQDAMKRRDMPAVYVLRGLLAVIANRRIELGAPTLAAPEIVALIQREAKKREEAEGFARQANRADLVEQNTAERRLLGAYLPASLSDDEITALVRGWIADGTTAMGALMSRLKEQHAGRYDGKRASDIVRGLLAGG